LSVSGDNYYTFTFTPPCDLTLFSNTEQYFRIYDNTSPFSQVDRYGTYTNDADAFDAYNSALLSDWYYELDNGEADSGGSDIYYPVLLFNDSMNIASTTCSLSATSSDCVLHYTTLFSPLTFFIFFLLFIFTAGLSFWIVKTFL